MALKFHALAYSQHWVSGCFWSTELSCCSCSEGPSPPSSHRAEEGTGAIEEVMGSGYTAHPSKLDIVKWPTGDMQTAQLSTKSNWDLSIPVVTSNLQWKSTWTTSPQRSQKWHSSFNYYGSSETCLGFLPALATSFGHASLAVSWQETEIVSKQRFICARMAENIVWTHPSAERGTPQDVTRRSQKRKCQSFHCWLLVLGSASLFGIKPKSKPATQFPTSHTIGWSSIVNSHINNDQHHDNIEYVTGKISGMRHFTPDIWCFLDIFL